jgi:hypothetical protein
MGKWYPQIPSLQHSSSSDNKGSILQRVHIISNSGTTKSTCTEKIPTQNLATSMNATSNQQTAIPSAREENTLPPPPRTIRSPVTSNGLHPSPVPPQPSRPRQISAHSTKTSPKFQPLHRHSPLRHPPLPPYQTHPAMAPGSHGLAQIGHHHPPRGITKPRHQLEWLSYTSASCDPGLEQAEMAIARLGLRQPPAHNTVAAPACAGKSKKKKKKH